MAKDLLLEIGTEEIPAKFMPGALRELESLTQSKLEAARIPFGQVRAVGTPRRLAVLVQGVAEQQADKCSENKGPSVKIAFGAGGEPTKAALGFARGQGVAVNELVVRDDYVYAIINEQGKPVAELLPELLPEIITGLNFPKNMRWGSLDLRFVRPIRWLVALYGDAVVNFTVADVAAGNLTRGHRFLGAKEIQLQSAADYVDSLAANYVMVDPDQRRQVIREQIEQLATAHGGVASIDEDLLEEVVYLVEYPTALCGGFDDAYLELPAAAVITPMREHQRYFPVTTVDGQLLPLFITVRNGGSEYLDIVQHGNERVLKARLADARFFFEEDKKTALTAKVEKLKTIVFQEGLGTLYDKTLRLQRLAQTVAQAAGVKANAAANLDRAAYLAKADLVTAMVTEFTELQGVMGQEYAKLDGEDQVVAHAIFEHYLPRFAGDALPQSVTGAVLSIADKLDNIVATFSRGLIPTGSQDPYALRRQALGVCNIIIQSQLHVSLTSVVNAAMELLGITDAGRRQQLVDDILEFFRVRLKGLFAEEHIRYDLIDAVMTAGTDDIYDAWLRASALTAAAGTPAFMLAVQALTRVNNLAKHAAAANVSPELFSDAAEQALFAAYSQANTAIQQAVADRDYEAVLDSIAAITQPIDDFFNAVMVMVEDEAVRSNRLALLKAISALTEDIADLNKVVA